MKYSEFWHWAGILLLFAGSFLLFFFGPPPMETQSAVASLRINQLVEIALLFSILAKLHNK